MTLRVLLTAVAASLGSPPRLAADETVAAPPPEVGLRSCGNEAPAATGPADPRRPARREKGRYREVGAWAGGVAGCVLGWLPILAMAYSEETTGVDVALGYAIWGGMTAGGAIAGYAMAGGFADRVDRVDQAIERGRESVRAGAAEMARMSRQEPAGFAHLPGTVVELRLAPVAGLDGLADGRGYQDRGIPIAEVR